MRRFLVIGIAITMVTVFAPVTGGTHLSAGYEDTVATGAEEAPGNPSVEGDTPGNDSTPYGIGTKTTDCYDPEAKVTADEVAEAATSHGFCGQLAYNEDTSYQIVSPPDQQLLGNEIETFDVQRTWYFGFGIGTCLPICDDSEDTASPQNATWNVLHTAGGEAGVTDAPGQAHEEEDSRFSTYNAEVQLGHAPGVLDRNTDVWRMNGWVVMAPGYGGSFVGYLEAAGGDAINGTELEEMITAAIDNGELSSETEVGICGYTPDRQFQSTGEQGFCESPMLWSPPDDARTTFDGYDDECESPTYVCGATTGGYWQAEAVGLVGAYGGRYQGEYMRHHWVIAPNQPDCANMEPGFDFGSDGADHPFLAHDLDVYTPPQSISGAPHTVATENLYSIDDEDDSYASALTSEQPSVPVVPTDDIEETSQPVRKGELLEPNHVGAENTAIDDSSRLAISEDRILGQGCSELGVTETDATNDPWVNYLDSGVVADRSVTLREPVVEARVPYTGGGAQTDTFGLYGSQDSQHDEDNDPTAGLYTTSGNVGVFADKNDDGDYDPVVGPNNALSGFGAGVYSGGNIEQVGAYPMLWDQHVNVTDSGNAEVDTESGCGFTNDHTFASAMDAAGYGPNTGLAQAIYLKEPAAFTDFDLTDPQVLPYAGGNNIYLFLNQAARELWDGELDDGADDFALSEEVDTLVENLRDHVTNTQGADAQTLNVIEPAAELGYDSDFNSQCGTDTGGFSLEVSFTHACETDCSGDTVATMYAFEVTNADGTVGGGPIPTFKVNGQGYDFGAGVHTWYDIDPFDGDPDRNEQRQPAPPSE